MKWPAVAPAPLLLSRELGLESSRGHSKPNQLLGLVSTSDAVEPFRKGLKSSTLGFD